MYWCTLAHLLGTELGKHMELSFAFGEALITSCRYLWSHSLPSVYNIWKYTMLIKEQSQSWHDFSHPIICEPRRTSRPSFRVTSCVAIQVTKGEFFPNQLDIYSIENNRDLSLSTQISFFFLRIKIFLDSQCGNWPCKCFRMEREQGGSSCPLRVSRPWDIFHLNYLESVLDCTCCVLWAEWRHRVINFPSAE